MDTERLLIEIKVMVAQRMANLASEVALKHFGLYYDSQVAETGDSTINLTTKQYFKNIQDAVDELSTELYDTLKDEIENIRNGF